MNVIGTYAQFISQSPDSTLVLHGGLRLSSFTTTVKYAESDPIQWPSYFYDGVTSRNSALSWSLGMNWQPNGDWTVRLLAASAFRAPNVDDIGKLRIKNDNAVVPNTELGPEQSLNAEINVNRTLGRWGSVSTTAFYTRLQNAIVRQNFSLPDGSRSFMDGSRTYNVEANVNAEEADIYGFSGNVKLKITRALELFNGVNYIRGQVLNGESMPLSHIPPLYGRTQLTYQLDNWNFTALSQFNAKKPIDQYGGSTDNPEYATSEGALGWTIFNLYADYSYRVFTFQLGIENLFDKHYRPFASGVSAPGRNFVFTVRGKF